MCKAGYKYPAVRKEEPVFQELASCVRILTNEAPLRYWLTKIEENTRMHHKHEAAHQPPGKQIKADYPGHGKEAVEKQRTYCY